MQVTACRALITGRRWRSTARVRTAAGSGMRAEERRRQRTDAPGLARPRRVPAFDDVQFSAGNGVGHATGDIWRAHRIVVTPDDLRRLANACNSSSMSMNPRVQARVIAMALPLSRSSECRATLGILGQCPATHERIAPWSKTCAQSMLHARLPTGCAAECKAPRQLGRRHVSASQAGPIESPMLADFVNRLRIAGAGLQSQQTCTWQSTRWGLRSNDVQVLAASCGWRHFSIAVIGLKCCRVWQVCYS